MVVWRPIEANNDCTLDSHESTYGFENLSLDVSSTCLALPFQRSIKACIVPVMAGDFLIVNIGRPSCVLENYSQSLFSV